MRNVSVNSSTKIADRSILRNGPHIEVEVVIVEGRSEEPYALRIVSIDGVRPKKLQLVGFIGSTRTISFWDDPEIAAKYAKDHSWQIAE